MHLSVHGNYFVVLLYIYSPMSNKFNPTSKESFNEVLSKYHEQHFNRYFNLKELEPISGLSILEDELNSHLIVLEKLQVQTAPKKTEIKKALWVMSNLKKCMKRLITKGSKGFLKC